MTMSHRQHIAFRELKEMREAEAREIREREQAERAERERPIREAEAAYKTTMTELAKITREKIMTQVDDERFTDPATESARMTVAAAKEYNAREIDAFRAENPDAYWSPANIDALDGYFQRNHLRIVSRQYLAAAWERLSQYGLLETPTPEPEPTLRPVAPEISEPQPEAYEGWDPDTGEPRAYTRWDVDRMSSEQYRRVFRIYKEALRLPNRPAF